MIRREIEGTLAALLKKYPAVNVTGPRQSGKTTLVRGIGGYGYFSLENPDTRDFALSDPRGFLSSCKRRFIIDEVQHAPALFAYLQEVLDSGSENGNVILLGSQSFLMNERISQSLAGRAASVKLLPLSYSEISSAASGAYGIDSLLFNGGYPRLYKEGIRPIDFFPHYMETYIQRDVRLLKNIGNLNAFTRFVKLCAGRIGSVLNISSLASDADIAVNTAKSWLSVLEASYVIFLLQPYYANVSSRLVKSPKLYFYDTGLACSLLNIEEEKQLESFYLRGSLFENFIFSELIKRRCNSGLPVNYYYFRNSKGVEVDCVCERAGKQILAEIKLSQTLSPSHFKNIDAVRKLLPNSEAESYLIYSGEQEPTYNGVKCLNWRNLIF
jgi:predicted AAA+ superfamily ATPase